MAILRVSINATQGSLTGRQPRQRGAVPKSLSDSVHR